MKQPPSILQFLNSSILLLCLLAIPLASCGTKGKLKTPAQIEAKEAKKASKEEKKKQQEEKEKQNSIEEIQNDQQPE